MSKKRKRIHWANFSMEFLKSVLYNDKTPINLRPEIDFQDKSALSPYMDQLYQQPDYFVKVYRNEIEDYFLKSSDQLKLVVKKLQGMSYSNIQEDTNEKMLANLKQKKTTQTLINAYLLAIKIVGIGKNEEFRTDFPKPISIDLTKVQMPKEGIKLYKYQEAAVLAMKKHFLDEDKNAGILQMPTGSGKTRTAVHFILTELIPRGYQIIWLAHRSMLIEQAAKTFYKLSSLVNENRENKLKMLNMICVSSDHCNAKLMSKTDHLIVSMVPSLYYSKKRLESVLQSKVMIVIDEAHHSTAMSYRTIIEEIHKHCPTAKLLGLSATPVRTADKDNQNLWKLYESNKPIFYMSMSKLINNGTLSKPIPKSIETSVDIETIINNEEIAHIQKMHDMPESLINKIAKTNTRNELIVDEYVNNKEKYGKTIIFALNGIHCMALNDELKKRGIRSGFLYTTNKDNAEVLKRFQDNSREDHIDVLININMLTEGSDIPDVQTVFLTRPTSSEALLMQMIGRGMRGIASGGTAEVNVIDFCDKWQNITRWLNPKFILELDDKPIDPIEKPEYTKYEITWWPWDLIRAVMNGITYKGASIIAADTVLPVGWFNIIDENGNDEQILIFDNQVENFKKMREDITYISQNLENADFNARELLIAYFSSFGVMPTEDDLEDLIMYYKNENKFPELQTFEMRDKIDPYIIAKGLKDKVQSFTDTMNQIKSIYESNQDMIDNLYGGLKPYEDQIVKYMTYPNAVAPLGTSIEEVEKEFYKLNPEPIDDTLDKLLDEVIAEQSVHLGKDFVRPSIYWTNRSVKTYFATYNYRDERKNDFILINKLLNSKSIPREALKFIIYHECLHQKLKKHNLEFRNLESEYPKFHEQEIFLDRTFKDFVPDYRM